NDFGLDVADKRPFAFVGFRLELKRLDNGGVVQRHRHLFVVISAAGHTQPVGAVRYVQELVRPLDIAPRLPQEGKVGGEKGHARARKRISGRLDGNRPGDIAQEVPRLKLLDPEFDPMGNLPPRFCALQHDTSPFWNKEPRRNKLSNSPGDCKVRCSGGATGPPEFTGRGRRAGMGSATGRTLDGQARPASVQVNYRAGIK